MRFKKLILERLRTVLQMLILIFAVQLTVCSSEVDKEALKAEILEIEKSFWEMSKNKSVPEAFLHFAAEDAVLNRNNQLIKGKQAIKEYFDKQTLKEFNLNWTPDFVDVSGSGDLAYTYGGYTFSAITYDGDSISGEGVFHTVWKRQTDGNWKYVWD